MSTATHHYGDSVPTQIERGINTGSKTVTVGMVMWLKEATATTPTKKYGSGSATACWAPATDCAAVDLEYGKFGICKTASAAVGADVEVYVAGQMIPALIETTTDEVSIVAGAPLLIDHQDDELISRAFAVTKTGLKQPIRFKSSITQATVHETVNTIYADIGYFGYTTGT